jgi:hypothetical protein
LINSASQIEKQRLFSPWSMELTHTRIKKS